MADYSKVSKEALSATAERREIVISNTEIAPAARDLVLEISDNGAGGDPPNRITVAAVDKETGKRMSFYADELIRDVSLLEKLRAVCSHAWADKLSAKE